MGVRTGGRAIRGLWLLKKKYPSAGWRLRLRASASTSRFERLESSRTASAAGAAPFGRCGGMRRPRSNQRRTEFPIRPSGGPLSSREPIPGDTRGLTVIAPGGFEEAAGTGATSTSVLLEASLSSGRERLRWHDDAKRACPRPIYGFEAVLKRL